VSYITQALPAFVLALICGYVAIAFASSPPDVSKWGVSRELWPKIYNAFVLQGVACCSRPTPGCAHDPRDAFVAIIFAKYGGELSASADRLAISVGRSCSPASASRCARGVAVSGVAQLMKPTGPVGERFLNDKRLITGIMGPVGSAKTTKCVAKMVKSALWQEPGPDGIYRAKWGVIRDTYPQLKKTVLATWHRWFPKALGDWNGEAPYEHTLRFSSSTAAASARSSSPSFSRRSARTRPRTSCAGGKSPAFG
jgi:hypothetical protein